MAQRREIRLTETEFHCFIENCIKTVLNEMAKPLTTDEFITKAVAKHGSTYDYSKVQYVNGKTPVVITCPKHGEFIQKPKNHLRGHGCQRCRRSRLERVVAIILDELKVNYTEHYRKEWLDKQHLDFYIEKYKTGIECQGIQHYEIVDFFGGKAKFWDQRKNDIIKQIRCISNNVGLEIISYEDSDSVIRQKVTNLISRLRDKTEEMED